MINQQGKNEVVMKIEIIEENDEGVSVGEILTVIGCYVSDRFNKVFQTSNPYDAEYLEATDEKGDMWHIYSDCWKVSSRSAKQSP